MALMGKIPLPGPRGALDELRSLPNVRLMTRTTAFGLYDGQVVGLSQRLMYAMRANLAERYWVVRTQKIILATGAIERPIAFGNNDRPGVMLAGALLTYLNAYGVLPGQAGLIFTNNDSAYQTARALAAQGVEVTLVDSRDQGRPPLAMGRSGHRGVEWPRHRRRDGPPARIGARGWSIYPRARCALWLAI